MKRRSFFNSIPAFCSAGALSVSGGYNSAASDSGHKAFSPDTLLAGMTLPELLEQHKHDLIERFIPFFMEHMVDHERGGFYPYTDLEGSPRDDGGKRIWWTGRGLWTVSTFYRLIDQNNDFLTIAEKAADLIIKNAPDGDNFWPSPLNHDGSPSSKQAPALYEDMFAAEGLAALAAATGEKRCRDLAKHTILKCLRRYDSPDYEYLSTYGLAIEPLKAPRILGHWMVFLNTCSQLLAVEHDNELLAVADRAIDALLEHHLNPSFDLMNEIICHDLSRPDNGFEQFSYTSHALETMWMLMSEAERRGDEALFTEAAHLFRRHVEVSWDDVYGGIFHGASHVDNNQWLLGKSMWAQVEVLVGCLLLFRHNGDTWAAEMYGKMYRYFQENYSLEDRGCPLWLLGGDRTLAAERAGTGDYYHNARWLMLSTVMLNDMV